MERITATWPDGRRVIYRDGEVSGDADLVTTLEREAPPVSHEFNLVGWRANGYRFMAAATALHASSLPKFNSKVV